MVNTVCIPTRERGNEIKRGYVDKAEHWRYSSARDYSGKLGLLEVCRQW
ncbi:hypothetical protein [Methyloprofundus sp.]